MKKIMSLISVFIVTILLVACSDDEVNSRLDDLDGTVESLDSSYVRKDYLQGFSASVAERLYQLESRLEALEEIYFDGVITVMLDYENDDLDTYKSIAYKTEDELSFFDLIDENLEITYDETTYGKYLTGIEELSPKNGAYIALYKNGEMASDGVETVSYENGDVFKFKIAWYDETEQSVDTAIQTFIENHASYGQDYLTADSIDYHVASAFSQLGILDQYLSFEDVSNYYRDFSSTNGKELFKAIIIVTALGGDPTNVAGNDLVEQLINVAPTGNYGVTALGSLALNAYDHNKDASTYETAIITDLTTTNKPTNIDVDSAGLTLIALSEYSDDDTVQAVIDETISYLSADKQAETGGITSTDMWTDPDNPTEVENSTSTAQVILGLVANGVDPTGGVFTTEDGNNLITRLLEYQLEDGSFKYKMGDDAADTLFTTPQAFSALVAYQQFNNAEEPTFNLYNFE